MAKFRVICASAGASVFIMAMAGCSSDEGVQEPSAPKGAIGAVGLEDSSEFDRDLIEAKRGIADPASRDRAIIALFEKYGVDFLHPHDESSAQEAVTAAGLTESGPITVKANASSFSAVRRDFTVSSGLETHGYRWLNVAKNATVGISAVGTTASADPFVVAYIYENISPTGQVIKVVAYNDDVSGANRNSALTWTNNLGADQRVYYFVFAYSSATSGRARVTVSNNGTVVISTPNAKLGGLASYGADPLPSNPPSNCNPRYTRTSLSLTAGGGDGPNAVVVDTQAMRGSHLQWFGDAANPTRTVNMPFLVQNNSYPSFAVIFTDEFYTYQGSTFRFVQKDIYGCVN